MLTFADLPRGGGSSSSAIAEVTRNAIIKAKIYNFFMNVLLYVCTQFNLASLNLILFFEKRLLMCRKMLLKKL